MALADHAHAVPARRDDRCRPRSAHFIEQAYREAGITRTDVDSGAVILTGEAIKRTNARAIDELFAAEAGKFVCATAGHKLECTLAAHGSGAVKLSRERGRACCTSTSAAAPPSWRWSTTGVILGVAAFAVGGRLLAADEQRRLDQDR